jgi:hypothetical protein
MRFYGAFFVGAFAPDKIDAAHDADAAALQADVDLLH